MHKSPCRLFSGLAAGLLLTTLMLAAGVSEKKYEAQTQQLQKVQAQSAAQQAEIAKMQQENKWVVASDMLFAEGGYQLTPSGKQALHQYVLPLQNLLKAKVVVYGYTDNLPVGPALGSAGANNIDLSSKRADNVVAYLTSQGVNPNIILAIGFGNTHAVRQTTHRKAASRSAASRSSWKGPAPDTGA